MSLRPTQQDWAFAARDLKTGLKAYNLWLLLGVNDIRQRYNRSKIGQFWIALSMGLFIGGIGLVYSVLLNQPVKEYIPYIVVNITIWTLISGVLTESANIFVQSSIYLRQDAVAKTVFAMRLLVRSLVILAHNLAIIPIAFLCFYFSCFYFSPSPLIILEFPGLLILVLSLFLFTLVLGVLSTRFRDLSQIAQNTLQSLFYNINYVAIRSDVLRSTRNSSLESSRRAIADRCRSNTRLCAFRRDIHDGY